MAKGRRRLSLNWLRAFLSRYAKGNVSGSAGGALLVFRILLVLCAGIIVFIGWFFIDRMQSYRVGYPSPRTYLAQSSVRFVDKEATDALRKQAAEQIVKVQVRNDEAASRILQRIDDLKTKGSFDQAPPRLVEFLNNLPQERRTRVISAAIGVAEENVNKSINWTEKSAMIWANLRSLNMSQADKNIIYQLLDPMLESTVKEDPEMTSRLRDAEGQKMPSSIREIRRGAILVQEGQLITPELANILRNQGYPDSAVPWKQLCFILIITFAWTVWLTWLGSKQEAKLTNKEWFYIAFLLAIDWSTQRWFAMWDIDSLSLLAMTGWLFLTLPAPFAFHVALGGGLIGYLLAFPGMTSTIAVGCIICGVAAGASFLFVKEASSRIMIWRNIFSLGLVLTFASVFIRWGFGLALSWQLVGLYLLFCACWSSLVVAILPLWETVFEIISPLRLLEMSHPSQPLLKRLQLEAPGTYHHTITVGTLAEAVADKLGMNGLLVKTGAYYHDIGKLKRPHYFVENQSFGDNIHDRLAPQESAKIILSHVTDGLKLADEYKLPGAIKRFISEHHGKTFLGYFYNKAVAADKEAGGDGDIDKAEYTYPGPTPQSVETALLMLADSMEAALKGLNRPLENKKELERLVGDVTDSKILSGQFAQVDFTLKDLSAIKAAFVEVLMPMYHTREIRPLPKMENDVQDRANSQEKGETAPDSPVGKADQPNRAV